LLGGLALHGWGLLRLRLSLSHLELRPWSLGKLRNGSLHGARLLSKNGGGLSHKAEASRERCRKKAKA
jgi:hypothetical protein